jgi:hypothetical protein
MHYKLTEHKTFKYYPTYEVRHPRCVELKLMGGKVQSITTIFIVRYEVESIARILL